MANITTTRQLRASLKHWKEEFGLQAWDIQISFCDPSELTNPTNDAEISWILDNQTAIIQILWPKFHSSKRPVEARLIHELLHIVLAFFPYEKTMQKLFESGVERAAAKFYRMSELIKTLEKERKRNSKNGRK